MNNQNTNTSTYSESNKNRFLFFFLLFLLSSIGMFGQTKEVEVAENVEIKASDKIVSVESQIEFVSWFMGTKQSQMMDSSSEKNNSRIITKKQILFLGITPNKVLYRSLMKKVSSQDNAIV